MIFYLDSEGEWYATQAEAKANAPAFRQVDVPTDKYGLLEWLQTYRLTLFDKIGQTMLATPAAPIEPPMTEDRFEELPLAMQLHLAALAMENARANIKGKPDETRSS